MNRNIPDDDDQDEIWIKRSSKLEIDACKVRSILQKRSAASFLLSYPVVSADADGGNAGGSWSLTTPKGTTEVTSPIRPRKPSRLL